MTYIKMKINIIFAITATCLCDSSLADLGSSDHSSLLAGVTTEIGHSVTAENFVQNSTESANQNEFVTEGFNYSTETPAGEELLNTENRSDVNENNGKSTVLLSELDNSNQTVRDPKALKDHEEDEEKNKPEKSSTPTHDFKDHSGEETGPKDTASNKISNKDSEKMQADEPSSDHDVLKDSNNQAGKMGRSNLGEVNEVSGHGATDAHGIHKEDESHMKKDNTDLEETVSDDISGVNPGHVNDHDHDNDHTHEDHTRRVDHTQAYSIDHKGNHTGNHTGNHSRHANPDHVRAGHEHYPVVVIDYARVQTPFIISVWIFLACLAKVGFHMTPKLSKVFPESCMLIILGVIIGLLLFYTHAATVSPLTADVFFIYMLPPIILDAGYFMPNRLFFDHLGTILLFAVVGTIWNALTIGICLYALGQLGMFSMDIPVLHMFLFSSLICAVDPVAVLAVFEEIHVEEVLFILVFGESLLNDGITVVLYHMFEGFSHIGQENLITRDYFAAVASFLLVALGGTAIGIIWGFLTAFVTRFTKGVRVIEPVFIFVMSYLAYLNAEIFHLSGILAITFCGVAMKNYTGQNISQKSQTTVKYTMKMLAQSSETIIFMFLGVSTVHVEQHVWDSAFVGMTILLCSVFRVLGTLMLSTLANTFRVQKIDFVQKFVISYGGLRGAVAFALVLTIDKAIIPAQPLFVTTTIAVVYFTVFFQGITIKPLVEMLGVKKSKNRKLTMNERLHERTMDYLMAGVEDMLGKHGNFYLRDKFKRFNNKYLIPLLVRDTVWSEPKLLETLKDIKMDEAMSYMHNHGAPPEQIESFAALYRTAQMGLNPEKKEGLTGQESWNLDVGELEYVPTAQNINDANFHHMLSEEYKPIKKRRPRMSYKRHAVTDEDVAEAGADAQAGPTAHRNMVIRKRQRNFKKDPVKSNGVHGDVGPIQKLNGTAVNLRNDYITQKMRDNPAFQEDETDPGSMQSKFKAYKRVSVRGPVVAETTLPWRRHIIADRPTRASINARRTSVDNDGSHVPTMAEMLLPWKRCGDGEGEEDVPRQAEHPSWAVNEDYVDADSPSNTYLHRVGDAPKPSVHDIFKRRVSSNSLYSIEESGNGIGDVRQEMANRRRRSTKGELVRQASKGENYWHSAVGEMSRRGMLGRAAELEQPTHGGSLLNTAIVEEEGPLSPPPQPSAPPLFGAPTNSAHFPNRPVNPRKTSSELPRLGEEYRPHSVIDMDLPQRDNKLHIEESDSVEYDDETRF